MRFPRIYTPQPLAAGTCIRLDARAAHHVIRVLRLRVGVSLRLFNGDGGEYGACILRSDKQEVEVEILDLSTATHHPDTGLRFTLIQGVAKGNHMDYALQKAVELGVHRLIPAWTEHGVVKLNKDRLARRTEHWQGILISASEQCGRRDLPELEPASELAVIVNGLQDEAMRLVLDPQASLGLPNLACPEGEVVILTGPEGGLSAAELDFVEAAGFKRVRLGPRILRTETAPVAALSALQALWGDFR